MKKYIVLIILVLFINLSGCERFVEGVNVNPNSFTDAPASLIIGQAGLASIMLSESQPARYAGIFTDQFTGSDRQFISYNSYQTTSGDFDDTWSTIYTAGLAQTRLVQQKATADGNKTLVGISQILEGLLMGEAAALFGDVPYSEAIEPQKFPNPSYDAQSAVFEKIQTVLSEGITNVTGGAVVPMEMFTGSYSWLEVGHSLKARYYLIAKNYAQAASEAKQGITSPSKTLSAKHSATLGQQNLFYQFGVLERGGYLTVQNSYLKRLMESKTVTAKRFLDTPGEEQRRAVYFNRDELNYNEGGKFAINASFPIISWEENQLILAEAEVRNGNSAAARTAFNAVRSQLAAQYKGDFPTTPSSGSTLLREILEEKYITLIGSTQVFHDIRRTQNLLKIPVKSATSSSVPQRFLYPQTEINTNKKFPGVIDLFTPTGVNK
jgi:starch-binding outer membrane protein, SusD/RagB family